MAYPGKEIIHPYSGERAVYLETASTTKGELFQQDVFMSVGGFVTVEHYHPFQEERFDVLLGKIRMRINGEEQIAVAGEKRVIPAGVRHIWWNDFDEEAKVRVEFRPALRIESLFENVAGLAKDGKVNKKTGLPNVLQLAVTGYYFKNELVATNPGPFVQKLMFIFLVPIARLLGYLPLYPEYSDP